MSRSGNCRLGPESRSIAVAPLPTWCLSWRNRSDRPRESPTATRGVPARSRGSIPATVRRPTATGSGTVAEPWARPHRHTRRSSTRSSSESAPTNPADTAPHASGIPSCRTTDPYGRTTLPSRNSTIPGPHGSPRHHTQPACRSMCSIPCTNPTPPTSNNGKGAPLVLRRISHLLVDAADNSEQCPLVSLTPETGKRGPDGIEIRRSGQHGTHSARQPAELRHLTTPPDKRPPRAVSRCRTPAVTCTNPIAGLDLAL